MKNTIGLIVLLALSYNTIEALSQDEVKEVTKVTSLLIADVASYGAYSIQIGVSQLRGDKDREKRLQFCLWETQNFLKAIKKAHTEEEMNAIGRLFADQLYVCNKLVSTL